MAKVPLLPRQPPLWTHPGALAPAHDGSSPDLSIVIVHHNTPDELQLCLEALARAHEEVSFQVIMVDQRSPSGLLATLRDRYPWLDVLDDHSDRGYAASNNLGLRRARGRYLLLLNPDVVASASALRALVAWMDGHPRAGYAGPRIVLPDGSLDLACRRSFPTPLVSLLRLSGLSRLFPASPFFGRYNLTHLPEDQTAPVEAVVGACMLIRREAAAQVGLLDETYFMYGEDLDWCYRLHAVGWQGRYVPEATVLHYKRSSSRRRPLRTTYEFYRAMLIFYRRHYAAHSPLPVTLLVLCGIFWRGAVALLLAWMGRRG